MKQTSHFLIGAASSGGGKTTFTTGLLRLFRDRGLNVQPYKCGPQRINLAIVNSLYVGLCLIFN